MWRGKVGSEREETRVKAGCAKRRRNWHWSAAARWLNGAASHPASSSPGQITILGTGRLRLCLSTPVLESWDHSSSPLNYLLFHRLGGNGAAGRVFGGKLMAADSLLKEKRNVLWMLCRACWDLQQMSSCLGDANEKQALERSENPRGLSYLLPLCCSPCLPTTSLRSNSLSIYKISTRNRESQTPSQASAHVLPELLG